MQEEQAIEREGAGTGSTQKPTKKAILKKHLTAKRMAFIAVFVALSLVVSFLEFPIFPATPYFKLDFGNVFIMLVGFLLGPVEGVLCCALKECLRMLSPGSTIVGELANMLITSAYILLPSLVYRFHKGFKTVCLTLSIACLLGTGMALLSNRYINFPLYMGAGAAAVFAEAFWWIVAFNLIKTVSVGLLTVLLYKRLSNFLKKMKI